MTSTSTTTNESAQLKQLDEWMQGLAIQKSAYDKVDVALWRQNIKPDEKNEIAATTYTARFMSYTQTYRLQGDDLLDDFQRHFDGWTQETWSAVDGDYKKALRTKERPFCTAIHHIANCGRPSTWRPNSTLERLHIGYERQDQMPSPILVSPNRHQDVINAEPPTPTLAPNDAPIPTPHTTHPTTYRFQHANLIQPITTPQLESPSQPISLEAYMKLPPDDLPNKFMKLWNKDDSYTGEPYNLLDDKLRIFLTICYNNHVKPSQFHALLPLILAGRAKSFYIDNIKCTITFRKAYDSFKQHFDTDVNKVHYFAEWTTITFNKLRAENATKSHHEVLQLLFDKLQLCQRALGKEYAGDVPLRLTLMNACRGVPELENALFKPADKTENLFADLRSSVENYLARRTSHQYPQYPEGSFDNNQYYLDRRYNNNRRGRSGPSGQANRGFGQSYNLKGTKVPVIYTRTVPMWVGTPPRLGRNSEGHYFRPLGYTLTVAG
ncbi:hypothetical protein HRG_013175 [Hirsutella rhossiliensis]